MSAIGEAPTFYRVVTPDGIALVIAEEKPWPQHCGVSHDLIELGDPDYISSGDGMLRFSPDRGSHALYGYAHEGDGPFSHWDLIRTEPQR